MKLLQLDLFDGLFLKSGVWFIEVYVFANGRRGKGIFDMFAFHVIGANCVR